MDIKWFEQNQRHLEWLATQDLNRAMGLMWDWNDNIAYDNVNCDMHDYYTVKFLREDDRA